jgi:hypothetical protein
MTIDQRGWTTQLGSKLRSEGRESLDSIRVGALKPRSPDREDDRGPQRQQDQADQISRQ